MTRNQFAQNKDTHIRKLFFGGIAALTLTLALSGWSWGGEDKPGTNTTMTLTQQQIQSVAAQYNALSGYKLTSADIQTLSSQGLLQGDDQNLLESLAGN